MTKTALVHHPIYEKHDTGPDHPETPLRYSVIMNALTSEQKLWNNLVEIKSQIHVSHKVELIINDDCAGYQRDTCGELKNNETLSKGEPSVA